MHRSKLILLYDSVEEYPHFVYFDMRDQKYYQTSRGYKAPPFREKYWILLTLTLLLARVSESVFSAYYSLFGPFIGFLLDTAFAVLTVFIGKRIALAFQLDKAMVSSVREASYEIQISQNDLKKKANDILIGYQKKQKYGFCICFYFCCTVGLNGIDQQRDAVCFCMRCMDDNLARDMVYGHWRTQKMAYGEFRG